MLHAMCHTLLIDTTKKDAIKIVLRKNDSIVSEKSISARRKQAEILLIEINKMLRKQDIDKKSLTEIEVANTGGSFTSLRIGVITANALGYGLCIPVKSQNQKLKNNKTKFNIIKPIYSN